MLEPLNAATEELSCEKFTSISKIIPTVNALKKKVENTTEELGIKLRENLKSYLGKPEEQKFLRLATLLDPSYKKRGFSSESI